MGDVTHGFLLMQLQWSLLSSNMHTIRYYPDSIYLCWWFTGSNDVHSACIMREYGIGGHWKLCIWLILCVIDVTGKLNYKLWILIFHAPLYSGDNDASAVKSFSSTNTICLKPAVVWKITKKGDTTLNITPHSPTIKAHRPGQLLYSKSERDQTSKSGQPQVPPSLQLAMT